MALYGSVPFLNSYHEKNSVGIFWFNAAEMFIDIGTEVQGKWVHWMVDTGDMDLFLIVTDTPKALAEKFVLLTGVP